MSSPKKLRSKGALTTQELPYGAKPRRAFRGVQNQPRTMRRE